MCVCVFVCINITLYHVCVYTNITLYHVKHACSKVWRIITLQSKHTRALHFENLCLGERGEILDSLPLQGN
jgi:hypothetical protein